MTWLTTGGMYGSLKYDVNRDEIIVCGSEPHGIGKKLSVPRNILLDFLEEQGILG